MVLAKTLPCALLVSSIYRAPSLFVANALQPVVNVTDFLITLGLQAIWHSDGIPERNLENSQQMTRKHVNFTSIQKSSKQQCIREIGKTKNNNKKQQQHI